MPATSRRLNTWKWRTAAGSSIAVAAWIRESLRRDRALILRSTLLASGAVGTSRSTAEHLQSSRLSTFAEMAPMLREHVVKLGGLSTRDQTWLIPGLTVVKVR